MELTEHGKKALIKVAEWLEAGAPHVTIDQYRSVDFFDMTETVDNNACGTACCIAGAIYQFEKLEGDLRMPFYDENSIGTVVNEFLGVTEEQSSPLFLPWDHFDGHDDFFSDAKIAAPVIRKFIETGVVEWPKDPNWDDGAA